MCSKLDRIWLCSIWVNKIKCWFSNQPCNITCKKKSLISIFIWIAKTDLLLYQFTNANSTKERTPTFMFWFRAVVQFWIKFPSQPHLLGIRFTGWFHRTWTKFLQEETELCSRCTPNVLQLLPGTLGLEEIGTVDIFKPHGSWGLSLQGTRLNPAQGNPSLKAQPGLIVQHQHHLLQFVLCFHGTYWLSSAGRQNGQSDRH